MTDETEYSGWRFWPNWKGLIIAPPVVGIFFYVRTKSFADSAPLLGALAGAIVALPLAAAVVLNIDLVSASTAKSRQHPAAV